MRSASVKCKRSKTYATILARLPPSPSAACREWKLLFPSSSSMTASMSSTGFFTGSFSRAANKDGNLLVQSLPFRVRSREAPSHTYPRSR